MQRGEIQINVGDIIGKRLGKLEVILYAGMRYDDTKGGLRLRHYYLCKCDCGQKYLVQRGPLKNDLVHSCGCSNYKRR